MLDDRISASIRSFLKPVIILPYYCVGILKNIPIFVLQPIAFSIVIYYKQLKYKV